MKWPFNKKKSNTIMVTAWQKLSLAINRKAHKWAAYLNKKTAKWSARKLKTVLVLFGMLWVASSVFVIWCAIENKQNTVTITHVAVPRHVTQPAIPVDDTTVTHAVTRIKHFKHWLDSLHQLGNPIYNRIVNARPGLLDSIAFIERYYSFKK